MTLSMVMTFKVKHQRHDSWKKEWIHLSPLNIFQNFFVQHSQESEKSSHKLEKHAKDISGKGLLLKIDKELFNSTIRK